MPAGTVRLPKSQLLQTKPWPHPHPIRVNHTDTPPEFNGCASLAALIHSLGPWFLSYSGSQPLQQPADPQESPLPPQLRVEVAGEVGGGSPLEAPRARPARAPAALRSSRAGAGAAAARLARAPLPRGPPLSSPVPRDHTPTPPAGASYRRSGPGAPASWLPAAASRGASSSAAAAASEAPAATPAAATVPAAAASRHCPCGSRPVAVSAGPVTAGPAAAAAPSSSLRLHLAAAETPWPHRKRVAWRSRERRAPGGGERGVRGRGWKPAAAGAGPGAWQVGPEPGPGAGWGFRGEGPTWEREVGETVGLGEGRWLKDGL